MKNRLGRSAKANPCFGLKVSSFSNFYGSELLNLFNECISRNTESMQIGNTNVPFIGFCQIFIIQLIDFIFDINGIKKDDEGCRFYKFKKGNLRSRSIFI